MSRLLFWLALAFLVVAAIRAKLREMSPRPPAAGPQPGRTDARRDALREAQSERMTSCAHCGVYFPASESVSADGRDYCCPAHVRLPPK